MAARTTNAEASAGYLSAVDDLMTRTLLDVGIFGQPRYGGRCTGKIDLVQRHLRARTEKGKEDTEEEDSRDLVHKVRTGALTVNDALSALLAFPSVENYNIKWSGEDGAEAILATHAKRFLLAFRPDSGIAFHETDRYTNPSAAVAGAMVKGKKKALPASIKAVVKNVPKTQIEVGVFATRAFRKGEVIQLRGALAELTDEEDDKLRDGKERSEFSVLWSERKKCYNLLLGPARFVNHCCRNNVVFLPSGSNMTFKVIEDIEADEELFTHYGDHYFDENNQSCLCTTCEQLARGAFAPSVPKVPVKAVKPAPAPYTPTRRTGRSVASVNYDEDAPIASTSSGTGHALTAQRSLRGRMTRSSSLPNLSAAADSTPKREIKPRGTPLRSLPTRISIIDTLRGQPRTVVQPKLRPPPGYIDDYLWDAKTKQATYDGPTTLEEIMPKPKPAELTRSLSEASGFGKRKRAASDTPKPRWKGWVVVEEPLSVEEARAREERLRKYQEKKERREKKVIRAGKRASARVSSAAAAKAQAMEVDGNLSSELSEAEDTEDVEEVEEESDAETENAEVAAMLSPAKQPSASGSSPRRSVTPRQSSLRHSSADSAPLFSLPGLDYSRRPAAAPSPVVAAPGETTTVQLVASRSTRSTRATTSQLSAVSAPSAVAPRHLSMSTSTPIEETPSPDLQHVMEEKKAFVPSEDEDEDDYDNVILLPVPASAKKELDDPDGPPRPHPRRSIAAPPAAFYSASTGAGGSANGAGSSSSNNSNSNLPDFRQAPSQGGGADPKRPTGEGGGDGIGGAGGGGGGGDDGRNGHNGRAPPVDKMDVDVAAEEEEDEKPVIDSAELGKGVEASASKEVQVADDPDGAVAALLMLLAAPPSHSSAHSPASSAPTPPQAESSSTFASNDTAAPLNVESAVKKGKRKRISDVSEAEPTPPPSLNPRSTRRQPKLASPEPAPIASTSAAPVKANGNVKKARIANSPAIVVSAPPRASRSRASTASQGPPPERESSPNTPPPVEPRRTRSKPIAGKLEDVLYAPETLAALGGYDHEKGRYISKHEALRAPSKDPRPPPRSPSPPEPVRSAPAKHINPAVFGDDGLPPCPPHIRRPRIPNPLSSSTNTNAVASSSRNPVASTSRIPIPSASRSTPLPPSSARRGSTGGASSTAATPGPAPARVHTRRSFPITQSMRDFIYSPAVLAASGGFDEEKGVYVSASAAAASSSSSQPIPSARRASSSSAVEPSALSSFKKKTRALSTSPALANGASASAPPEGTRSTRRSFPMAATSLQDLVYGDAARRANGGWDEELGRYVSASAAAKAAAEAASPPPSSRSNGSKKGGRGR